MAVTILGEPVLVQSSTGNILDITSTGQISTRLHDSDGNAILNTSSGLVVSSNQHGTWNLTNISGTVSLPTGAATATNQITTHNKLDILNSSTGLININLTTIEESANYNNDQLNILNSSTGFISSRLTTIDLDIKDAQPRKLQDGAGNNVTSQISGSQRALDIGVTVSGLQVDPRQIRSLTVSDAVTASQGGTWNINNVSGSVSLPTGAATSANQILTNEKLDTLNSSTGIINTNLENINDSLTIINNNIDSTNSELNILNSSTGLVNLNLTTIEESVNYTNNQLNILNSSTGLTNINLGIINDSIAITNNKLDISNSSTGLININLVNINDSVELSNDKLDILITSTGLVNINLGIINDSIELTNDKFDVLNSSSGLVNINLSTIEESINYTNNQLEILNSSTGYISDILTTIDTDIKAHQARKLYDKDDNGITSTALGSTKRGIDIINRDSRGIEYSTTAFGILKIANDSTIADYRFLDIDTVNGLLTTTNTGSGSWSLEGTALKLNTGAAANSKCQLDSKQLHYYQSGHGQMIRISAILSDIGVTGNIREWGYGNNDNGVFFRMDGTTLQAIIRKGGSDVYIKNSSQWDVPVTPNQYGHLYYIQIEWLGVGNIYFWYDGNLVHTYNFLGTSTGFSLNTPDLPIRIRNKNTTNNTNVSLKVGGISVIMEGGLLISGKDYDGKIRPVLSDNTGRLIVITPPPQTPLNRTRISDIYYANSSGTTDRYVIIPIGKQVYIQRFKAGAENSVSASVCELYYAPNGNTTGIVIIEPIFTNGSSDFVDMDYLSETGNDTRAILMRIRNLTGGSLWIFGKWEGYY